MAVSLESQQASNTALRDRIVHHLNVIYPAAKSDYADRLMAAMHYQEPLHAPEPFENRWNENDVLMITYGDSISRTHEKPLHTLRYFLHRHFKETVNSVHILPFFPYSSDDGFSVINYRQVNDTLGEWSDIEEVAAEFRLMSDLVINHCSSRSEWFEQFKRNEDPGKNYFVTEDPSIDLSEVIRPRTNPLLREVETLNGTRHVWCTFSHDQVDLNFANPDVLVEFAAIIAFYLDRGIKIFRLDAIAFVWKRIGTNCLNLTETHEIVRLLRTLIEHRDPNALIITETNIPNRENLAYFGNGNEAHIIYNFALPPLLLHGMLSGSNHYLNNWLMSMPPAQDGTTYLNFIASHDGIGLRPIEGILTDEEVGQIMSTMEQFGGRISWRNLNHKETKPYEINISLFSAMKGTFAGEDGYQIERFICAHTIMAALEGIPAFYIHSLLATPNDLERVENTGNNRSINRHIWDADELEALLMDENSNHTRVLSRITKMLTIRRQQPAFHPNATQYTLHLGEGLFAFWRQSRRRDQSIFCVHNISCEPQSICLGDLNLIDTQSWRDLFTGNYYQDIRGTVALAPYQSLWLTNR